MLTLDGITAGYGKTVVLRDVQLSVPPGRVVALLGANGAGKTTLLRVASGLLAARTGRLLIGGRDHTGAAPEALQAAGICHVPEGRGVFPSLTVRENLRLFCSPATEAQGVEQAVEAFPRLGERLDQAAGTMSGGEQQMLALCHAYVSDPQYILLDEVSMGLAPKIVEEIFEYLHDLARQGKSMLLVEQYVAQALKLADYVYIMDRGTITFAGEPGEISEETIMNSYLGSLAS